MGSLEPHEIEVRWPVAAPFVVVALLAIVAAGLTSAASAFAPSYQASWAVAYLVLVVGISQLVLGLGWARLSPLPPSRLTVGLAWASYNSGNAGVLLGTLADLPALTVTGAVLLAASLVVLHIRDGGPRLRWLLRLYRLVLVILFVSIPVGLIIARFS